MRHTNKVRMSIPKGEKQSMKTVPEEDQMLDFTDINFISAIYKLFKVLKEIMSKELKCDNYVSSNRKSQ